MDSKSSDTATASEPGPVEEATRYFELAYKDIAPFNMALSILTILLNVPVIAHYCMSRSSLTFVIFILISVSDIFTAAGNLVFAGGTVLWTGNMRSYDGAMWWCYLSYRVVGLFGYSCSVFFNTLLAVWRSITIYNPFYQPRVVIIKIAAIGYIFLLLSLIAYDMYFLATLKPGMPKLFSDTLLFWFFLVSQASILTFPGQAIAWALWIAGGFEDIPSAAVEFTLLSVQYLLPVLAVVASMIVQVVVRWQRSRTRDADEDATAINWRHINTTVFLVAVLNFVCNSALSLHFIAVEVQILHVNNTPDWMYRALGVAQTTLPLLNASFSPIIIVARSARMKQAVRSCFIAVFGGQRQENV